MARHVRGRAAYDHGRLLQRHRREPWNASREIAGRFHLSGPPSSSAGVEIYSRPRLRYDRAGGLFISVLTNPTMGGVAASFASLGDLVFAEPKALIGFAGPRTIKATIRLELPKGFQTSEFLLEHGFVDRIVHRARLKSEIARSIDYCGK